jgi:hypothetical protein
MYKVKRFNESIWSRISGKHHSKSDRVLIKFIVNVIKAIYEEKLDMHYWIWNPSYTNKDESYMEIGVNPEHAPTSKFYMKIEKFATSGEEMNIKINIKSEFWKDDAKKINLHLDVDPYGEETWEDETGNRDIKIDTKIRRSFDIQNAILSLKYKRDIKLKKIQKRIKREDRERQEIEKSKLADQLKNKKII